MRDSEPMARITAPASISRRPSSPAIATRPGPANEPSPRITVAPAPSSAATWPWSSGQSIFSRLIIQSRKSDAFGHG